MNSSTDSLADPTPADPAAATPSPTTNGAGDATSNHAVESTDADPTAGGSFDDIELSPVMRAALARAGYERPSPVQAGVIPHALKGVDVLGQARTGTGKTASFAIPILEMLDEAKGGALPQALVLAPTRELAVQVRDEFEKLAHGRKARCVPVYGGKPIKGQISKLERGCEVVVGTPGRVLDH
ncbi:MAG: DEAD/DEAH box helicase, partial [Planctomycetota bacterium]